MAALPDAFAPDGFSGHPAIPAIFTSQAGFGLAWDGENDFGEAIAPSPLGGDWSPAGGGGPGATGPTGGGGSGGGAGFAGWSGPGPTTGGLPGGGVAGNSGTGNAGKPGKPGSGSGSPGGSPAAPGPAGGAPQPPASPSPEPTASSCSSSSYSSQPVRYANGEVRIIVQDLATAGFGHGWGHTRSYTNKLNGAPTLAQNRNGTNWFVKELPQLVSSTTGTTPTITVIGIIQDSLWFDWNGSAYVARDFIRETLTRSGTGTGDEFMLLETNGRRWRFYGFDSAIDPALQGQFKGFKDAFGHATDASYNADYQPVTFSQTSSSSSSSSSSSYGYSYLPSSDENAGRLETVKLSVNNQPVRQASYTYHAAASADGTAGDLRSVAIEQLSGLTAGADVNAPVISKTYYRYYKNGDSLGYNHALKFLVGPPAYSLLLAAGFEPELAPDEVLIQYADNYFEYDPTSQRVTREVVSGNLPGYQFSYAALAPSTDYNTAVLKTVEVLPDGSKQWIAFTNFAGQITAKIFKDGSDKWYEAYQYDANGRGTLRANSSAVSAINESTGVVAFNGSTGVIWTYGYNTSGAAVGYLNRISVQTGSGGAAAQIYGWAYGTRSVAAGTISPTVTARAYSAAGVSAAITYDYTAWSGDFQAQIIRTNWPAITGPQNGSNSPNFRDDVYDDYGFNTWTRDERLYLTRYSYDYSTGSLIEWINDVDTARITDSPAVPSGWMSTPVPPNPTHLHLITDYTVDNLGRTTQELGPIHSIDIGGASTSIRRAMWSVYDDPNHQQSSGSGYVNEATGAATLINPVALSFFNAGWSLSDLISATRTDTAGALSLADVFPQSNWVRWTHFTYDAAGHLVEQRDYFAIPSCGNGSSGVNYGETLYAYDAGQRTNRVLSPDGTITRIVYTSRGWVAGIWTGTADSGATASAPDGGGAGTLGNDMVQVTGYVYDAGGTGGDGLLTSLVQYVDATTTRVTGYTYDPINRCVAVAVSSGATTYYYATYTYDNLNRCLTVQVWNGNSGVPANLRAQRQMLYDGLGRLYQGKRYGVDQTNGAVATPTLSDQFWYDPSGNLVKVYKKGGRWFLKGSYDALNRLAADYYCFSLAELSTHTYSAALSVADNTVVHQDEFKYDDASNVILNTSRQRFHNTSGTGPLGFATGTPPPPNARVTYAATYPDALGRTQATANFGTCGANSFSRPDVIPESGDLVLVGRNSYNQRGELLDVTDPRGMATRYGLDDQGRLVEMIENYLPGISSTEANKTTGFTYTPGGLVLTQTAKNEATGDQVTRYLYGTSVSASDSDVSTQGLLKAIIYPDSTDDGFGVAAYDRVEFCWNRQGELKQRKDQNATVHAYDYDGLGRWLHDRVIANTAVDNTVKRISRTFAQNGRVSTISSFDTVTIGLGIVPLNQVQWVYNAFRQLITEYQEHAGAVNTSTSKKVQYQYENGTYNHVRRKAIIYASGTTITYGYGTADGMDDVLCRVTSLQDSGGPSATYTYLGWERRAQVRMTAAENLILSYIKPAGESNGDAGDQYTGWDRFDRVEQVRYDQDNGSSSSTSSAVDRVQYGFDRADNRLWRAELVAPPYMQQDERYNYDGLSQLTKLARGNLNINRTAAGGIPSWEEDWQFDATGNWNSDPASGSAYIQRVNGAVALNQNRTHNEGNEITAISGGTTPWLPPTYDAAGNTLTIPSPITPATTLYCTYDAWNRLVAASTSTSATPMYVYDGMGRRIVKNGSPAKHYYYSDQWQVLDYYSGTALVYLFVWGLRYPDDLLYRGVKSGGTTVPSFALHDHLNITGIVDGNGTVQKRFGYDGYGTSRVMDASFAVTGTSDWEFRFGAAFWDAETGLYLMRYRYQHPKLGRWLTADPGGYQTSFANLYWYCNNNPKTLADPSGLTVVNTGVEWCVLSALAGTCPRHEYLKIDGKSYGYWYKVPQGQQDISGRRAYFGLTPGEIRSPDTYNGQGTCTKIKLDTNCYDIDVFRSCVKDKVGEWTAKPPPFGAVFGNICIDFTTSVIDGCKSEAWQAKVGL